jgi:hypothetical protein
MRALNDAVPQLHSWREVLHEAQRLTLPTRLHNFEVIGNEILFSKGKIAIAPGANVEVTLKLATRIVSRKRPTRP